MNWLLIIWIMSANVPIVAEFTSQAACSEALKTIKSVELSSKGVCVPKGELAESPTPTPEPEPTPTPTPEPTPIPPSSSVKSLVFFGDSITAGYEGRDVGYEYGYRDHLMNLLGSGYSSSGSSCDSAGCHLGIGGTTTSQALNRVDEILKYNPDAVLIFLGVNDLIANVPLTQSMENINNILMKIKASNSQCKIFLALITPSKDVSVSSYNHSIFSRFSSLANVYIVDMETPFSGHPEYMADNNHPNDSGYQIIAKQWENKIKSNF